MSEAGTIEMWSLYVTIVVLVIDVLMALKKIWKWINIKRHVIPTNSNLLEELRKINRPEIIESLNAVDDAEKKLIEAKTRAKRSITVYHK